MRLVPQVLYARKESLGANQSIEIQVGLGGFDFLLTALAGKGSAGAFRFNVIPNDTGRRLFQSQIESLLLFQSNTTPVPYRIDGGPYSTPEGVLSSALRVKRSTTVNVELLDISGAVNTIQLAMIGFELYPS